MDVRADTDTSDGSRLPSARAASAVSVGASRLRKQTVCWKCRRQPVSGGRSRRALFTLAMLIGGSNDIHVALNAVQSRSGIALPKLRCYRGLC